MSGPLKDEDNLYIQNSATDYPIPRRRVPENGVIIIIIIIIIINCNWVVSRWKWLFYILTSSQQSGI